MTDDPMNSSFAVGSCYSWNGPVCPTCSRGYLGRHECTVEDVQRRIDGLQRKIEQLRGRPTEQPSACPCAPLNGGARVCMNVACPYATKVTC